ncbi:nucleotidyltransferase family protein [Halioxenophilus sp. WMMB6]|uniref:nucleotidyltransferase family protein n=1 Tax=Halioxenophilus sp. WMMB6 TaxID=3073815 RepID=UPI00295F1450|nr:nucleotidyltransferase family protein [Halioxenophilus sp. WMMB6]
MTRSDSVLAVVMAAGFSERFGTADKRLAQFHNGQALLAATLAKLTPHFCELCVVLRPEDNPRELGLPEATTILWSYHAAQGLSASIADAFQQILAQEKFHPFSAAAVFLGDMPWITSQTLVQLLSVCAKEKIVRPIYSVPEKGFSVGLCSAAKDQVEGGEPGHPVIFGRSYWPELAALTAEQGGMAVIKKHRKNYREVAVTDPGVVTDIDYPEDLTRIKPISAEKANPNAE